MAEPDVPEVDVVVTHYDDPRRLAWVLEALAAQDVPRQLCHVIVADDGSPTLPDVPAGTVLVTQPDEGFRAAAARNLGARQGTAPYVLFLDGDTVPEPGYVRAMTATLRDADRGTGALVVGRRRHADLTGVAQSSTVQRWLADPSSRSTDHLLEDPQWLQDGYERTADLRETGPDDWRLVISAVMGMTRREFETVGGFDETLVGYGGEDWDLAYRAWNTGCALQHASNAQAWHDGPDAGGRDDLARVKEHEQLALAARIPQPLVRGRGLHWPTARIVVRIATPNLTPSAGYALADSWLGLGDVALFGLDPDALGISDARVRAGAPSPDQLMRAEIVVDLDAPLRLADPQALLAACDHAPQAATGLRARRTRHDRLGLPASELPDGIVERMTDGGTVDLESWGRRWWR